MDEQTTKLLQALALQLGTTSEFLWGVLLLQARLYGVSTLVASIAFGSFLTFVYRCIDTHPLFDSETEPDGYMFSRIIWWAVFFVFFIIILCNISDMLAAFFNPEYLALNHILRALR